MSKPKPHKKPYTTRHLELNLFNADIVLVISDWDMLLPVAEEMMDASRYEALKEMVERHGDDPTTLATTFPFAGGGSMISARHGTDFGTLVHESVHAAVHLLSKRSTPLSSDTEEVYAYLIEHIVRGLTGK